MKPLTVSSVAEAASLARITRAVLCFFAFLFSLCSSAGFEEAIPASLDPQVILRAGEPEVRSCRSDVSPVARPRPCATPQQLLTRLYQRSRILILGIPGHGQVSHYQLISDFLRSIKDDARFGSLVLERYHDVTDVLESLSKIRNPSAEKIAELHGDRCRVLNSICASDEWAWTFKNLIPPIADWNARRKKPIVIRSVDGVSSRAESLLLPIDDVKPPRIDPDCQGEAGGAVPIFLMSHDREQATADRFYDEIASKLARNEKVVLIYHHGHTVRGIDRCAFTSMGGKNGSVIRGPATWVERLLEKHPELRSMLNTVLFDIPGTSENPNGVLSVTKTLQRQCATASGGVMLDPSDFPRGTFWAAGSFASEYMGDSHSIGKSRNRLPFDAVIWDNHPTSRFSKAGEIFPSLCSTDADALVNEAQQVCH